VKSALKKKKIIFFIVLFIAAPSLLAETTIQNSNKLEQNTSQSVNSNLPPLKDDSAYGRMLRDEEKIGNNQFAVDLFNPNYVLPFYYTQTPDQKVYGDTTPDHQKVMRQELQGQISFQVPMVRNIFNENSSLNVAYTQLMMWQVYANSQYFRETDYMPEIFVVQRYGTHWIGRYSIVHQSNGRGGDMERSWNRAYAETIYSGKNWMVSVKPWILIFAHESTTVHNPDIIHYMGHGEITAAIKTKDDLVFSTMVRNNVESRFQRGAEEVNLSFPIHGHFRGYVKFFSGYGQTLIEYNHYTNAVGIGIMLNDII